jgi:nucleotide-binding universal stress UspA family protein
MHKANRDEIVLAEVRSQAQAHLDQFAARCAAAGVDCRTLLLEGDPVKLLAAWGQQVDLLVVGRKSPPPDLGVSASRVLRDLLHHSTRPVLCVPRANGSGTAALVAYDGSVQAAKTLQAFLHLGLAAGQDVHVLHVAREGSDRSAPEAAIEYLRLHGHTAHLHVDTSHASPAAVIVREAQRLGAGVIVLGAFGQPAIKEFFFGSVTNSVLEASTVPLFLFH